MQTPLTLYEARKAIESIPTEKDVLLNAVLDFLLQGSNIEEDFADLIKKAKTKQEKYNVLDNKRGMEICYLFSTRCGSSYALINALIIALGKAAAFSVLDAEVLQAIETVSLGVRESFAQARAKMMEITNEERGAEMLDGLVVSLKKKGKTSSWQGLEALKEIADRISP